MGGKVPPQEVPMVHGITPAQMVEILMGVQPGSKVFVSYLAGRPATERAVQESQVARDQGIASRHHTGVYSSLKLTKKGEWVLTIWTDTRTSTDKDGNQVNGAYRAINPCIGTLLTLEVLEHAPVPQVTEELPLAAE